jgi:hypothetical protein
VQPAPVADDKNTDIPASDADAQNPEDVTETPEQQEAKKESRRARQAARRAAELAAARTEARIYKEQLEALKSKETATNAPAEPKREDFDDYEAYLDARTDYRASLKIAEARESARKDQQGEQEKKRQQEVSEKVTKAWTEREKSFSSTVKDYTEVVTPFVEGELQAFSHEARMAMVESDVGPAVLDYLARNDDVVDRILGMSPIRQAAEIGRLEAKLSRPAIKTTSAPAPAELTRGGKTATKDLAKMTQDEYEAHRKSQGATWARRG